MLLVKIDGQANKRADDEIEQQKSEALGPPIFAQPDGRVAHPGNDAKPEKKQEADDVPCLGDKVHGDVDLAELLRLGKLVRGQRVVGKIGVEGCGVELLLGVDVGGVLGGCFAG